MWQNDYLKLMNKLLTFSTLFLFFCLLSCSNDRNDNKKIISKPNAKLKEKIIIDCHYTFDESIAGSNAPKEILNQLQLITVKYYSTDGKIHQGQILTNKKIVHELLELLKFMFQQHFPIAQAIPIVKYEWNDDLSMKANNTSSFCYRNASYSKHATGMAIDINPYFNPVRWKSGYEHRIDKPIGAIYNPKVSGTFYDSHPVILKFKAFGFRWGHSFKRNYDDHHFEK